MKEIKVVTIFPEMLQAITDFGITQRAIQNGLLRVDAVNLRDFATDKHKTVDDRPFGGGPGMVMRYEPLVEAVKTAKKACLP